VVNLEINNGEGSIEERRWEGGGLDGNSAKNISIKQLFNLGGVEFEERAVAPSTQVRFFKELILNPCNTVDRSL